MSNNSSINYKVLAFALQFKRVQSNGEWYNGISLHKLLKSRLKLRSSYNSLKKYVTILQDLDCFVQKGNHTQLEDYYTIAEKLNIPIEGKYINQYLRDIPISDMLTGKVSDEIIKILYKYNFKAQHKYVEKANKQYNDCLQILTGSRNRDKKKPSYNDIYKRAKKSGESFDSFVQSTVDKGKQNIVTGCYHLGNIFGTSHNKANKLIQQLVSEGFMNRRIVKGVIYCNKRYTDVNQLKAIIGIKEVHMRFKSGYSYIKGSEITLTDSNNSVPIIKNKSRLIFHNYS